MLETTSYAILPSNVNKKTEIRHEIQSIQTFHWDGQTLSGTLSKGTFVLYFIDHQTMRLIVNPFGNADCTPSIAAIGDRNRISGTVTETKDSIHLHTEKHEVIVQKRPFSIAIHQENQLVFKTAEPAVAYTRDKHLYFSVMKNPPAAIYGLGEKTGFLNKNGAKISNWNTDVYAPHNKDTVELYQTIPFVLVHDMDRTTGIFFDNTYRTEFDMQTYHDKLQIMAEGGQVNAYIMLGSDLKEVVASYTNLTGKTPLPPKWALGYHQSRYSYGSQDEVRQVMQRFKDYHIPLDCIFLDIHYMNGYRVFTFDEDQFPAYEALICELNENNVDVVPIVDPGVKKDIDYHVYREGIEKGYFSKYAEGHVYFGEVWPGMSAFPDFLNSEVQTWWGELHRFYTNLGIRGIWNDMNEPSVFNESKTMDLNVMHNVDGKQITHREAHNVYGLYMSKATFEGLQKQLGNGRPFSLTRAGYAGVQRYSAVWTGDNRSHWEHLEMSMPMIMNLGLSGVAFTGADVGGFSSDATPELLIRWTQAGVFLPYFRNHSVQDSIYQEPWAFGEETLASVKKYIELRYRFMPCLYTLFYEAEQTGLPVVRPLVMEYPKDPETLQCSDQFLLGSQILIAPMVRPGQRYRSVYLPKGTWFDFWTNEEYEGGKYHLIEADLNTLPIFVKSGTILPLGTPVKNTKETQDIELYVYLSGEDVVSGHLYEDDGYTYDYQRDQYSFTTFTLKNETEGYYLMKQQKGSFTQRQAIKDVKLIGRDAPITIETKPSS
ncbi:TIM-barrel domain-containing protein [Bacillus sp. 165]|uniref:glycoside hydrolase family 31 protein n=1 Tax=Bacillus sp. 165 TaxID=1529117 RepID=UPI001ADC8ADA|nr:TIM-barrel domain-containing protein [Bacillus sp. 165]MBO9129266.1 glycoside hydrolase family 31 protein [Bacillus sp. 165]